MQLLMSNVELVLDLAAPFAANQTVANLIHLRPSKLLQVSDAVLSICSFYLSISLGLHHLLLTRLLQT